MKFVNDEYYSECCLLLADLTCLALENANGYKKNEALA